MKCEAGKEDSGVYLLYVLLAVQREQKWGLSIEIRMRKTTMTR